MLKGPEIPIIPPSSGQYLSRASVSTSTNLPVAGCTREIMPYHAIAGTEHICGLRKTNTVLYGIFLDIVRQFYMNGPDGYLIGAPEVTWSSDESKTKIWIDTELRWEDTRPEFRPAIYVHLGGLEFNSPLDQHEPTGFEMRDASYTYSRIGAGTVTFTHVAESGGEACILCDNTATYLTTFSSQIRKDYCFSKFSERQRTAIQQAKPESSERYSSSTSFGFEFAENWTVKLESPKLKVVDFVVSGDRQPDWSRQTGTGWGNINSETRVPRV